MSTKLWDKGFEPDRMIEEYTVGQDRELDLRLARYDVEGSLAHIAMLEKIGLLTREELESLTAGLQQIAAQIEARSHTADEYILPEEIAEGIAVYHRFIENLALEYEH